MKRISRLAFAGLLSSTGAVALFISTGSHADEPEHCNNPAIEQAAASPNFATAVKTDPKYAAKYAHLLDDLGLRYENQKNFAEALPCYRWSADLGDTLAEFNLGRMYFDGTGVTKDFGESESWLRKSADKGDSHAEALLGSELVQGNNFPKDVDEGVQLMRKAAEAGNTNAAMVLGVWLIDGEKVPQDITGGMALLRKAAAEGNASAKVVLGKLERAETRAQEAAKDSDEAPVTSAAPSDAVILRLYRAYWRKMADNIGKANVSSLTRGARDSSSAMGVPVQNDPVMDRVGQMFGLDRLMQAKAAQLRDQIDNQIVTVVSKRKYEDNWVVELRIRQRGTDSVGFEKMILAPNNGVWAASVPAMGNAPAYFGFQN
jgi:TPR repeat protein